MHAKLAEIDLLFAKTVASNPLRALRSLREIILHAMLAKPAEIDLLFAETVAR
jgi:hypothetical protein